MGTLHVLLVLLPACGALAMLFVAAFGLTGPEIPGRRAFGWFAAAVGSWCLAAALEYLATSFPVRKLFGQAIYLGAATAPVAWFVFAARYTGWDGWLGARLRGALLLVPLTTVLLAFTNDHHGWLWRSVTMVSEPLPDLVIDHGPWFRFVHAPYSYGFGLAGIVLLVSRFFGDLVEYRSQTIGLVSSAALVLFANAAYVATGFSIHGMDPTPVLGSLFTIGVAVSLFQGFLRDPPLSYREVFMATTDAVFMLGRDGRIIDCNPATEALTGARNVRQQPLANALPWLDEAWRDGREEVPAGGAGEEGCFEIRRCDLRSRAGQMLGTALLLRDVTAERRERARLRELARLDSLTQITNRGAFMTGLGERMAPGCEPFTLLYVDLNDFKAINDRHGHRTGDAVLVEVARRIQQWLGSGDQVGRLGGDEFAILTARAPNDALDEVRTLFERPVLVEGKAIALDAAVGEARWPADGDGPDALFDAADRRMYDAKGRLGDDASRPRWRQGRRDSQT